MVFFPGVNKHFQMACIWNKFTSSINKNVTSEAIWKRLETMYDLATLVSLTIKI